MRSFFKSLAGRRPPLQLVLLSHLVGVVALKDLLVTNLPLNALRREGEFAFPALPFLRPPVRTGSTEVVAFVVLALAIFAALCLIRGVFRRPAALVLLLVYGGSLLLDQISLTTNGFLMVTLSALIAIEPLDPARRSPMYPLRMGQILVTVMYVAAGVAKLTRHWLSGDVLRDALFHYHVVYPRYMNWDSPPAFQVLAILSCAFELGVIVALWIPRTRRYAMGAGIVFHLLIDVLLPVRMFSYLAPSMYAFFAPHDTIAPLYRWKHPYKGLGIFVLGVAAAFAIDLFFTRVLEAYPLPTLNVLAFVMALVPFVVFLLFGLVKEPSITLRPTLPEALRAPAVLAFAAFELFLMTKPYYGFSDRLSWNMFHESTQLKAQLLVREGGEWKERPVYGRWNSQSMRYYWETYSAERIAMQGFARWYAREKAPGQDVKVVATYRLNNGPIRTEEFLGN